MTITNEQAKIIGKEIGQEIGKALIRVTRRADPMGRLPEAITKLAHEVGSAIGEKLAEKS